jgi:hypothetical protein
MRDAPSKRDERQAKASSNLLDSQLSLNFILASVERFTSPSAWVSYGVVAFWSFGFYVFKVLLLDIT